MQENSDALDMGTYIVALRRHWLAVLLPFVLTIGAAAAVTYTQTPIYEATTEAALEPIRDSDEADLRDLFLGTSAISTEVRVLTSNAVTERVIAELELSAAPRAVAGKIDVDLISGTRVVRINATDADPAFAATLANTYATEYFDYRRERALDEIVAARETLTERATRLRDDLDAVEDQISDAGLSVDDTANADQSPLLLERDRLVEQLAQVENQLDTIGTTSSDLRGGGEILVAAEPPSSPIVPQPLRNLALAAVLGLTLGIGLALLRDYLDDVVRAESDVRRAAQGAPVVGRVGAWDDDAADRKLITLVDPYASASEEFQAMAANVRFALISRAGRHPASRSEFAGRSVAITSSAQTEGKTTVAGNLAVATAGAGREVILIGGDLRKPTLARRLGLPNAAGLTDLLAESHHAHSSQMIDDYLIDVGLPRLRVLPAGSIPPNPTELLASARMAWLHSALEEMADLIIYDTPPLLPVADTLELSQHVDLTFVVVRTGQTHRRDLAHAIERLQGVGAEFGGIVLNGLEAPRGGYGSYDYSYRPQREYRPQTEPDDPSSTPPAFSAVRVRKTAPPPPQDEAPTRSSRAKSEKKAEKAEKDGKNETSQRSVTAKGDGTLSSLPPPAAPAPPSNGSGSGRPTPDSGQPHAGGSAASGGEDEDLDSWLFRRS